jgi:hypothetical protein
MISQWFLGHGKKLALLLDGSRIEMNSGFMPHTAQVFALKCDAEQSKKHSIFLCFFPNRNCKAHPNIHADIHGRPHVHCVLLRSECMGWKRKESVSQKGGFWGKEIRNDDAEQSDTKELYAESSQAK